MKYTCMNENKIQSTMIKRVTTRDDPKKKMVKYQGPTK